MAAILIPITVNGQALDNGLTHRLHDIQKVQGILEAIALETGATRPTFDGPIKAYAQDQAFPERRFSIEGRLINLRGFLSKWEALEALQKTFAGRPAIVRVGSLYLEATFGQVQAVDDDYKRLGGYLTYRVEGEAIPGTFTGVYGFAQGAAQGVVVQDDRPDHPSLKFAANTFTFTSPGTAPSEAVVAITGTPSTTVYLKGAGLRRVPVNLDASGYGRIDEASGFIVYPGAQTIRVEDAAGALAAGVTAVNLYGTRFRFLGNAGNRFAEGLVLQHHRTGPATYISTAGALTTAGDGVARFGLPYGPFVSSKVGLLLEGGTTNKLSSNQATGTDALGTTSGFSVAASSLINAGASIASVTTEAAQGSRSLSVTTSGSSANQGVETTDITASANTWHTASVMVKAPAGTSLQLMLRDYTNAVSGTRNHTATGGWDCLNVSVQTGGSSVLSMRLAVRVTTASALTFYVDALQIEAQPFPTSWVDGTRAADLCGLVPPQQELIHSHDLTQGAVGSGTWNRTAGASVTKAGADNTLTLAATSDAIYQAVSPASIPGTTRTAAVRLKLGTLSGSVRLRLLDQAGTAIASTTISTADLSASEYRTFTVTGTPGGSVTGLRVQLIGNAGTGTVLVRSLSLVQGWHPGIEVQTGDASILAPTSPAMDLAWQQNGRIKARTLPPPIGTGKSYALLGNSQGGTIVTYGGARFCLWRYSDDPASSARIYFERSHDGSGGSDGTVGRSVLSSPTATNSIYDGAPHDVELEWTNYVGIDGIRYMWQRLYIDGTLISERNVAAAYGAKAWSSIDLSRIISGGGVFAVLIEAVPAYPALPAGAIPAT